MGGIALVVVLWTVLLLSLIAAGFLALTRTEVRPARERGRERPCRGAGRCRSRHPGPARALLIKGF